MYERYRLECPEGHTVVIRRGQRDDIDPHWYCDSCKQAYDQVRDKKANDWVDARRSIRV